MNGIVQLLGEGPALQSCDDGAALEADIRHQDRLITVAAMVADLIAADGGGASIAPDELNVESWSLWKDAAGGIVLRVNLAGGLGLSLQMGEATARSLFDSLAQDEAQEPPAPRH